MKKCSKCQATKNFDQFNKKSNHKDGYNSQCKECRKDYSKNYHLINKTKIRTNNQQYYLLHKEQCLESCRQYRNKIKEDRRIFYMQLKTGPCMDCGNTFDPECMDFDHRPNEKKSFEISRYAGGGQTRISKKKLLDEIAKCDLICANCHRLRTKARRLARAHGRI